MKKVTFAFIILVIILFAGIFIMMQPKFGIAVVAKQDEATLKPIVKVGAYLSVIGLVGLAVLGFVISFHRNGKEEQVKELIDDEEGENSA